MTKTVWYKVAARRDELPDGRVKSVTCGVETICLAHFDGQLAALDNRSTPQATIVSAITSAALEHDGASVIEVIADAALI